MTVIYKRLGSNQAFMTDFRLPDVTDDDEPDLVAEQIKEELSKSAEPVNLTEVTDWLECDRAIESSEFLTDEAPS